MDVVLDRAPEMVRECLARIYYDDFTVQEAAATVGLSRFVVGRAIGSFVADMNSITEGRGVLAYT